MQQRRRLFCEHGPLCYRIAAEKECLRRDCVDWLRRTPLARQKSDRLLPAVWKSHSSLMVRTLLGVDPALQRSKVQNLLLAGRELDGLVVRPGEVFSFWNTIGRCTARRGYREGMTIIIDHVGSAVGGGLCQMANLIHYMVLHTPLAVTELHHHSDALFPDSGRRVPFGTGTSVFYKNVDYRFRNTTEEPVQLHIWQDDEFLYGELRSTRPLGERYRLEEVGSGFVCENGVWYRRSEVWRTVTDRTSGELLRRERILQNHSRVLYDPALIPPEQILHREPAPAPEQKAGAAQ